MRGQWWRRLDFEVDLHAHLRNDGAREVQVNLEVFLTTFASAPGRQFGKHALLGASTVKRSMLEDASKDSRCTCGCLGVQVACTVGT